MANLPWDDWDLPEIYLILMTVLLLVFIGWLISFILIPFYLGRKKRTQAEDKFPIDRDDYEAEDLDDYAELVITCTECDSNIEVRTNSFPTWVDCGICGACCAGCL